MHRDGAPPSKPIGDLSSDGWSRLVASIHPASLLVVIESRMSRPLRARLSAEDVLQEALLHAWRDRATFDWKGPHSFRAWLLRIVDHRLHDAVDRHTAIKRGGPSAAASLDSDGMLCGPAISETPSRLAMHRETAAAISAALASLPEDVEPVVRLRLFEHVPTEEIALQLGIGHAAVRHRLRRGAALYRRVLMAHLASRSRRSKAG